MRTNFIKMIVAAGGLLGLLLVVGDTPGATLPAFVAVKALGLGLICGSARLFERITPREEV